MGVPPSVTDIRTELEGTGICVRYAGCKVRFGLEVQREQEEAGSTVPRGHCSLRQRIVSIFKYSGLPLSYYWTQVPVSLDI